MPIGSVTKCTEKVWVEISQDAILHNVNQIREIIGSHVTLLAVVKADAYGLGLEEITRVLWMHGVNVFGVTNVQEGIVVKRFLPKAMVLILGPSFLDNIDEILDWDLIPIVSSLEILRRLNEAAMNREKEVNVHLMMDTGMGRIGLWYEKGEDFFKELLRLKFIRIQGVASHFASSDCESIEFSKIQLNRFQDFLFKLKVMGFGIPFVHIANSGALLRFNESFFNMVRIGLLIYGVYPSSFSPKNNFHPALSWKSRIAFIKDVEAGRTVSYGATFTADRKTKIATLPVGYSHGFDRRLSNRGEVLIGGRRCPVVGRVTMDQIMVDLGPDSEAKVDDEVVIIGVQGSEHISLEEMAQNADTIPYELMCGLKVKKLFV